MRTAIFGGVQCLQICICIRAVRLSRFVELSQLSGGFLTESSLVLRHTVAVQVPGDFEEFVLLLSFCCFLVLSCDVPHLFVVFITIGRCGSSLGNILQSRLQYMPPSKL